MKDEKISVSYTLDPKLSRVENLIEPVNRLLAILALYAKQASLLITSAEKSRARTFTVDLQHKTDTVRMSFDMDIGAHRVTFDSLGFKMRKRILDLKLTRGQSSDGKMTNTYSVSLRKFQEKIIEIAGLMEHHVLEEESRLATDAANRKIRFARAEELVKSMVTKGFKARYSGEGDRVQLDHGVEVRVRETYYTLSFNLKSNIIVSHAESIPLYLQVYYHDLDRALDAARDLVASS